MNDRRRALAVLAVFLVTLFTGSALLFLIQPMFAKMVLPLLGGTPAVWATSMVFFQATLLVGYAYAHWSVARLGIRRQALLHIPLVLLPLLVLPIAVPAGWDPPTQGRPVAWLLLLLAASLGLPFFVLSASAPLLQRWFASTGHPSGRDPYFLYAASNAGSMLALLAYPFGIEPSLALNVQSRVWAAGYGVLAAGTIVCALVVVRARGRQEEDSAAAGSEGGVAQEPIAAARRLKWVVLAFVPSAFMLAATTYISTDIAAIPLLWVIPLALYLLTFIMVFSTRPPSLFWASRLQAVVILALVFLMLVDSSSLPRYVVLGLPLLALFLSALVCHAQLAIDRPAPSHLTEFYLWIAVGGVGGGIFTALLAPVLFTSLLEYPLVIVMACLLMPAFGKGKIKSGKEWLVLALIPSVVTLGTVLLIMGVGRWLPTIGRIVAIALAVGLCAFLVARPLRFGLALGAVLIGATIGTADRSIVLYSERTFFGVHQVLGDSGGRFHRLMHGTTLHGIQSTDPALKTEPLSYYHRDSPIGHLLTALPAAESPEIGVIGLGTGTLACYARPEQRWTFFEIDPVIEAIARDPELFSFMSDCPGEHEVVLGDARLSLNDVPDGSFGVLVVDAFTSDAIPVHLLTREAVELYLEKTAPGGAVAFHISNRYLDLRPVLANIAWDLQLSSLHGVTGHTLEMLTLGKTSSDWVVLTRAQDDLGSLPHDPRWSEMVAEPGRRVWTDDFSDVFSVFSWRTG